MKKASVLFVTLATALGLSIPVQAEEGGFGEFDQSAPVEEGDYNSYIVVMGDDPLLADLEQDELDTAAAEAEGGETQSEPLRSLGGRGS